ncbi:MAG: c-type cytochrome, partial [Gemmataceae bacterium]
DGKSIVMQSGNTYRMKPDGSHAEQFTHGQVNPFGLCFDPLGNLYSADCHSMPLTQLLHGAQYVSFNKPHDGLGFAPHLIDFGQEHSTALCGVVYYEADQFPIEYRSRLYLGDVVYSRLNSYTLEWHGSTPKAHFHKFLTSDDPWFRPVDQKLGPDGAIYVADFYNRIIGHYEVPLNHPGRDRDSGRIWRIVWRGEKGEAPTLKRPYDDLRKESVVKLVELLGHANLTVRMQAMHQLVERGNENIEPIRSAMSARGTGSQRACGLWVLERLRAADAKTIENAVTDADPSVRVHAMRVLAERPKWSDKVSVSVWATLTESNATLVRAAVEALGVHPSPTTMQALMNFRSTVSADDVELVYAARLALRNNLSDPAMWKSLPKNLDAKQREALADIMPALPTPESADFLLTYLQSAQPPMNQTQSLVQFIARQGGEQTRDAVVKFGQGRGDLREQVGLLQAVQRGLQERGSGLTPPAKAWAEELTGKLLASADAGLKQAGAEVAGSARVASAQPRLREIALDRKAGDGPRGAAFAALVTLDASNVALLGGVLADATESNAIRSKAAALLGSLNTPAARGELLKALPTAPAVVASAIANGLASTTPGGGELLKAVAEGKASPRLLQERDVAIRLQQAKVPNLTERVAKLTAGLPAADQRINDLMKQRHDHFASAKTDAVLGAQVFEKNCAACHQLNGKGTKVGPQLDGVGARGLDRLLEDVLDPNRNVDPAFRATRITLKDGRDLTGLVLREEGEVVVLADNLGKEVRVEKKTIEERTISPLSPMPANWADVIPEPEFHNLMAFLLTQRGK